MEKNEWEVSNHQMLEARYGHSCLYLDNAVIAVGGIGTKTTEIFDLNLEFWRYGGDLPKKSAYVSLLKSNPSSEYRAILIGGKSDNRDVHSAIYGLTKDLRTFEKIGNLKVPRYGHVAMVLPEKSVNNCVDEN